jgi:V/A-type H+-transporting ATPase subunit I
MPWREALRPVVMQRVALVAPSDGLRDLLVNAADEGTVDFDDAGATGSTDRDTSLAASRLQHLPSGTAPTIAVTAPDVDHCEQAGRFDLILGEAELERRAARAVTKGHVSALAGWMPSSELAHLAERVAVVGAAVLPLRPPAGAQPPTLLPQRGPAREFAPLVETYATVPYADVNPALLAGLAYVAMFGMMFADVGHGALLLLIAVAIRRQWSTRLARLRPGWLFLAGAGLSSMIFGALYGEFFGPTDVIPVLWLAPLDHPMLLLGAAVAVGAVLLAGAYALGSVNRFREGGWRRAIYAPSGLAGAAVFVGLAGVAVGGYFSHTWLIAIGVAMVATGLGAAFIGLRAGAGGGPGGAAQAGVESFDLVVRLASNLVSFARLAAFGLTHAALAAVIWSAAVGAWKHGVLGTLAAVVIFLAGNAVAFALEGLVAGIQALRLEFYELFSRIFDSEGRPYRPWHIPLSDSEVPCSPG